MPIENGDFVRLEYTGTIKETGDVFDTTNEEVAKEANIYREEKEYSPIPIVVGGQHLLKALEEAIVGLDEGDTKHVEIAPVDGFGERNPSLVQLFTVKDFKKQGLNPVVGLEFTLDGHRGKVINVSGGRVKVDFNHDLAGKTLEYDVVISQIITDDEEKIKSMIQLHYAYPNLDLDKTEIKIDGNTLQIGLDEITRFDQKSYMDITLARFRIAKDIWENMDFDKVQFFDTFEKRDLGEEEEESNEETPKEEESNAEE